MDDLLDRPWAEGALLGFDTETTGVDFETDRLVSVTVILADPSAGTRVHEWLIDPGVEIPVSASEVHGITTEQAAKFGRNPAEAVREIWQMLSRWWTPERPLVGHNPTFDLTMLDREIGRHLGESLMILGPVIDTLTIDREQDRYVRGSGQRKLVPACRRYGLPEFKAHDATEDVRAALRLAWAQSRRFPRTVGLVPPAVLHDRQKTWYRSWADGYASYVMRQIAVLDRGVKFDMPHLVRPLLDEGVEPTVDAVAAKRAELVARAADVRASAGDWPLRPRPVVTEGA